MSEPALSIPVAELAREIAKHLADELRAVPLDGLIDQHSSPLGARRHITAIRSGSMPGYRIGRRWLARKDDVEAHAAKLNGKPVPRRSAAEELERRLLGK